MKEVVRVKLENEMDLILAHKRSMKLGELSGLSLTAQTSVATAVSEIARCAIEFGRGSQLSLGINSIAGKKYLTAVIRAKQESGYREACAYARKLVDHIQVTESAQEVSITLGQALMFPGRFTDNRIQSLVEFFKQEPPLSSYDEIRKKNLLLQNLADKIKESEHDFRTLTDSLPLLMFSVNGTNDITYTNKWLQNFFGSAPAQLHRQHWKQLIHQDDFAHFAEELEAAMNEQIAFNGQFRFIEKTKGDFLWHIFSIIPLKQENGSLTNWIGFMVDIHAQKLVEQTLQDNVELKRTQVELQAKQNELERKIEELNRSNYELEQFAYLASHDLQEPLRKLFYYSDVLKTKYADLIDSAGRKMLNNLGFAAGRMKELITDLLSYSQLHHKDTAFQRIDLNTLIKDVIYDFDVTVKEKKASFKISTLPSIEGNSIKLKQLFRNVISNSLKYSKADTPPEIQIESSSISQHLTVSIKDNGIGFDDRYSEKIFGLFQRLHTKDKFPGTGIGLSVCKKIVELHGGKITAHAAVGNGATFRIMLPFVHEPKIGITI